MLRRGWLYATVSLFSISRGKYKKNPPRRQIHVKAKIFEARPPRDTLVTVKNNARFWINTLFGRHVHLRIDRVYFNAPRARVCSNLSNLSTATALLLLRRQDSCWSAEKKSNVMSRNTRALTKSSLTKLTSARCGIGPHTHQ